MTGTTKITLEMSPDDAKKVVQAFQEGRLPSFVVDAQHLDGKPGTMSCHTAKPWDRTRFSESAIKLLESPRAGEHLAAAWLVVKDYASEPDGETQTNVPETMDEFRAVAEKCGFHSSELITALRAALTGNRIIFGILDVVWLL